MPIDKSLLEGEAGLVRSTTISSDSQTTTMRDGNDLINLAKYQERDASCDVRAGSMRGIFMFRGKPQQFRGDS
jgi:hypothetical protein